MIDYEIELRPVLRRLADIGHIGIADQIGKLLSVEGGNRPLCTQTFLMPAFSIFS